MIKREVDVNNAARRSVNCLVVGQKIDYELQCDALTLIKH